jgi:hypothetical protein
MTKNYVKARYTPVLKSCFQGSVPAELNTLPAEILLEIYSYLPMESAACLTMCSKRMLTKLRNECLRKINHLHQAKKLVPFNLLRISRISTIFAHPQEREKFLILIAQDSPDFTYCYYCKQIHDPDETIPQKHCSPEQRRCSKIEG